MKKLLQSDLWKYVFAGSWAFLATYALGQAAALWAITHGVEDQHTAVIGGFCLGFCLAAGLFYFAIYRPLRKEADAVLMAAGKIFADLIFSRARRGQKRDVLPGDEWKNQEGHDE